VRGLRGERSEVHEYPLPNFPDFRFSHFRAPLRNFEKTGFKKYSKKNFPDFHFYLKIGGRHYATTWITTKLFGHNDQ
jgi:hypothetical protein